MPGAEGARVASVTDASVGRAVVVVLDVVVTKVERRHVEVNEGEIDGITVCAPTAAKGLVIAGDSDDLADVALDGHQVVLQAENITVVEPVLANFGAPLVKTDDSPATIAVGVFVSMVFHGVGEVINMRRHGAAAVAAGLARLFAAFGSCSVGGAHLILGRGLEANVSGRHISPAGISFSVLRSAKGASGPSVADTSERASVKVFLTGTELRSALGAAVSVGRGAVDVELLKQVVDFHAVLVVSRPVHERLVDRGHEDDLVLPRSDESIGNGSSIIDNALEVNLHFKEISTRVVEVPDFNGFAPGVDAGETDTTVVAGGIKG